MTTIRETAEELAAKIWCDAYAPAPTVGIVMLIQNALLAERERCAKIAEDERVLDWIGGSTGNAIGTARRIATVIREGENYNENV